MTVQIHNEKGDGEIEVKGMNEGDYRAMLSGTINQRPEKMALLKKWVKKDLEIKKKLTWVQMAGRHADYLMENQPEMIDRMNKLLSQRKMSSPRKPGFGVGDLGNVWGDFTMLDGTTLRVALYFIELQKQHDVGLQQHMKQNPEKFEGKEVFANVFIHNTVLGN